MLIKLSVGVNTPIITRIITNPLKTVSRLKTRHSSLSHTAATCGTWIQPNLCSVQWCWWETEMGNFHKEVKSLKNHRGNMSFICISGLWTQTTVSRQVRVSALISDRINYDWYLNCSIWYIHFSAQEHTRSSAPWPREDKYRSFCDSARTCVRRRSNDSIL